MKNLTKNINTILFSVIGILFVVYGLLEVEEIMTLIGVCFIILGFTTRSTK
ncbi:MAG: hypothetical protein U0M06_10745 [Clostridia bacterium]|nr:hypothetical protein [Clostridia bacterium]